MDRSTDLEFRKNKWHGNQAGDRRVHGEDMNEMRAGAELFDQRQRELNCVQ